MKKFIFLLIVFSFQLIGCVTPYQNAGLRGGFSEIQLSENVFQVSFEGNGYTTKKRATDFALLRSAELTLQKGFAYFIVSEDQFDSKITTFTTPTNSHTTGNAYIYGNTAQIDLQTKTSPGNTYTITKPIISKTILMFKVKPMNGTLIYDAKLICSSLGQKYDIFCDNSLSESTQQFIHNEANKIYGSSN